MPDIYMNVDQNLAEVPVNLLPLLDSTDFVTRETAVAFNAAGMDLVWNFVTTAGAYTQTAVTPTAGGDYDWANQGDGMYSIEIPASGGVSINNDTEGFGWFTGYATGILPWRGPIIAFRASGLNDKLINSAYSATRGLAGTALPDAAADGAGGLPISDAGGLDLDTKASYLTAPVAREGADGDTLETLSDQLDGVPAAVGARTIEGAYTCDQLMRIMAAVLAGKLSGGGTATVIFRSVDDTANRVVATITADGDRTSVTLTP